MGEEQKKGWDVDLYNLPSDPKPEQLIELLAGIPSEIGFIENQLVELKKSISDVKVLIKGKKRSLELQQAAIRSECSKKYRQKLREWVDEYPDKVRSLEEHGLSKVEARDLAKQLKPEKPTKSDLDDLALTKTDGIQMEIERFENQATAIEHQYEALKVKYHNLDNNFRATQSIKGLVQREMER